jgi:hypothetical protein
MGRERFPQVNVSGERAVGIRQMTGGHIHTGDVIFQGIPQLLPEYAGQLRNFLDSYLGTPGNPVPFGGRGEELEALNSWLREPEAPPYLLLTAPAGRGKSALVAQWVDLLVTAGDPQLDIIYFPISIRYQTNREEVVFASLAARLARLRGKTEELRSRLGSSVQAWRELVSEYLLSPLPGRQLLLVLDGLDEAAGWELGPEMFPVRSIPGIRVLVSARLTDRARTPQDWRESLGWQRRSRARTMELLGLDRVGVEEALRSMGAPLDGIAERVDIVGQLLRLSEGDPLLVGLYVESLWEQGDDVIRLRPEELASLTPGLRSYFRRWWRDQERLWGEGAASARMAARPILNLLACALGPLRIEDLLWLTRDSASLDLQALREVLRILGRFVIGDGRDQGYVFAHPRLAAFFWDEDSEEGLPVSEQSLVESHFLTYGAYVVAALNDGRILPTAVPPYVVWHYGAHLTRFGSRKPSGVPLADWEALVSEGWWRAWLALEGSYGGFLGDVDRAREAVQAHNRAATARSEPVQRLGLEVLCVMCHTRVAALAGNLVPELGAALVRNGVWTLPQALSYARRIQNPTRRVQLLTLLLEFPSGDLQKELAVEAFEAVEQIGDEWLRARILVSLVPHLPAVVLPQALRSAQQIDDEGPRAQVLVSLVPYLPEDLIASTRQAAQQIGHTGRRAEALAALAPRLPRAERAAVLIQALQCAQQIRDEGSRAEALASLATHLSKVQRAEVFSQALQTAQQIEHEGARVKALASLAPHLPKREREEVLGQALRTAQEIWDERMRADALAVLKPDPWRVQRGVFENILDKRTRTTALRSLALHLSESQRATELGQALQFAQQISDEASQAQALVSLAAHLPETLLGEALQAAQLIREERWRVQVLAALSPYLPNELLAHALEYAQYVGDEGPRTEALVALAPHMPEELFVQALPFARQIRDEEWQAEALTSLAPHLPANLFAQALHVVGEIRNEARRTEVLVLFAPHLPEALHTHALHLAQYVDDEESRAQVLSSLAPHLAGVKSFRAALGVAKQISRDGPRAKVLASLAPRAPKSLHAQILRAVQKTGDERLWGQVLDSLAGHSSESPQQQALKAAQWIDDDDHDRDELRAQTLASLASRLPKVRRAELVAQALQAAQQISDASARIEALVVLAGQLPKARQAKVFDEALRAAQKLPWWQAETLAWIVPYLPQSQRTVVIRQVLHSVQRMHVEARVEIFALLAPHLPQAQRAEVISQTLQPVQWISDGRKRAETLASLALYLPKGHRPEVYGQVLEAARQISDARTRSEALASLALHLPKGHRPDVYGQALQAARQISDARTRSEALASLAAHLPTEQWTEVYGEALQAARQISDARTRSEALAALAAHLPTEQRTEVYGEALQAAQQIRDKLLRVKAVAALASHVPESQAMTMMKDMCSAEAGLPVTNALFTSLAPRIPSPLSYELWSLVLAGASPSLRGSEVRLITLASNLGGKGAVAELANAFLTACRWWP